MDERLNCPNCGAPIEDWKCAYCGTVLLSVGAIEIGAPTFVRIKTKHGKYRLVQIKITSICREPSEGVLWADNRVMEYVTSTNHRTVELELVPFGKFGVWGVATDGRREIPPEVWDQIVKGENT